MSPLEIAKLTKQQRQTLQVNAHKKLSKNPNDLEAKAALHELKQLSQGNFIQVGAISWESHQASPKMRGFDGEKEVGVIYKNENHTSTNDKVYDLEVLRERIDSFRHLKVARSKAAEVYSAKMKYLKAANRDVAEAD